MSAQLRQFKAWLPLLPPLQVCLGVSPTGALKCPKGFGTYTLKKTDKCPALVQNRFLNFKNPGQIEAINKPLTGFTCSKAVANQIICYPPNCKLKHLLFQVL